VELPVARSGLAGFGDASKAKVGNPYLGLEFPTGQSHDRIELGVRLPLTGENATNATIVGLYSDIAREEAFAPGMIAVRAAVHSYHPATAMSRFAYDLRLGPTVSIARKLRSVDESQVSLGYGGTLRYEGAAVRAGLGLTGRWNVLNGSGLGVSTAHQAEFAADFLHGAVRPGVQLKIPLGMVLRSEVDRVVGVTITVLQSDEP
jgi:hypothetical protein